MHASTPAALFALLAIASVPETLARSPVVGAARWLDEVVRRDLDPREVVNPLATTPEMRRLAATLGRGPDQLQQLTALQSALFDAREFTFTYDIEVSLTADEAFRSRRGNCVAFTNLFIALARSIGAPVRAAVLRRDPASEREGDLVFVNTHVVAAYPHGSRVIVYDFSRQHRGDLAGLRLLDDLEVSAIYHNNRAMARLREGDLSGARQELDLTLRLAPKFTAAHANLGVVLRRAGDTPGAFDAYREALELAPRDATTLGNLAILYRSLGREREARLAIQSADLRTATPHTLLVRGDLEAADGNIGKAIALYKRARRLDPALPSPHVAIARAEAARDRLRAARRALDKALAIAPEDAEALELDATLRRRASQ